MRINLKKMDYKKIYPFISFVSTCLCMLLFFLVNQMFLGGEYLPLRSDNLQGEFGALRSVARDIVNGQNIWFAYNMGTGVNNSMVVALFFSPFNILHILLLNADPNFVTILILTLKISCISLSFNYFCKKVLNNNSFFSVIFSVYFSMSAYVIAYGTVQTSWLDGLIILPLLCSEIINCIKTIKEFY